MNYVFFDVECANCLNGEGKICSFGYVKTDSDFNVIKKKDLIINPNAPFLLGNVRTGQGIKLAYPLFKFRQSYTFPHYYQEIKTLLEDKNNLCFGFAVHQDASYIAYSCQRYALPIIKFFFYDIQQLEKMLYGRKNTSGLDHLVSQFELKSYTYHRSDDDALMSMEVLQAILKDKELTISDILEKYKDCGDDVDHFISILSDRKKNKEKRKEFARKKSKLYSSEQKEDLESYDSYFWRKKFYIDWRALAKNIDELNNTLNIFLKKGGTYVKSVDEADYIILLAKKDIDKMDIDEEKKKKIVYYNKFISKLKQK